MVDQLASVVRGFQEGFSRPQNVVIIPEDEKVEPSSLADLKEATLIEDLILREDLELVLFDRGEISPVNSANKEKVSCKCGSCGGVSSLFSNNCDYCGVEKPHLMLKKKGEEWVSIDSERKFAPGTATLSNYGRDDESSVEYKYDTAIRVDDRVRAPILRSPIVSTGEGSEVFLVDSIAFTGGEGLRANEIRGQVVVLEKNSSVGLVRVMEKGSFNFERGVTINILQVDRSVSIDKIPKNVTIGKIVVGDFPMSDELKQFLD